MSGTGRVRLRPDVRIHVQDGENAFVETPESVRRLRGRRLALLGEVLPLLHRPTSAEEITAAVGSASAADVRALLAGLSATGLLADGPVAAAVPAPREVLAVGDPQLLHALDVAVRDLPGTRLDVVPGDVDTSAVAGLVAERTASLVLVATQALLDPWPAAVSHACVRAGRPVLVFGLDSGAQAFVGPLWHPGQVAACYACLRARLHMNSVHGTTRLAYQRHLEHRAARPLGHTLPPPALAHLAGWVGWRARCWLSGGDERTDDLLWLDGESLTATRHRVFAVPTCTTCGDHQRAAAHLVRPVADLEAAQDTRCGMVHSVSSRRSDVGPAIFLAGSTSPDLSQLTPALRVVNNGGAGYTEEAARRAALGESLERYVAGIYRRCELVLSAWRDLGEEALHPSALGFFSAEQYAEPAFPFVPFDEATPVRWVRAVRWHDRRTVLVPASQVFLPYRLAPGEAALAPSVSTGLAAGPTLDQAVLGGLFEVLERDALAVSWLHRLPPRPVPHTAVTASEQVRGHLATRRTWQVRFYDLSLDLSPPVVAAVLDDDSDGRAVMSFGSACRPSLTEAVEKAFLEAAQGQSYVRRLLDDHAGWEADEDFGNVDDFHRHAILYTRYPALRARVGYLVDPAAPVRRQPRSAADAPSHRPGDPAATLAALCEELRAAGHPVHVVDLSTPDVRQVGVRVVRVLVPGLQHLAGAHRFRLLGNRRLHEVTRRLGWNSTPDNPYPHPLP
jgi:ribosomal protein S12 methylthiotransferase accessory factor